ncbi:MAG TPA: hypothetical protein VHJ82_03630 [Actinomycetota bacterium]|nr:hypothetical protein [Actinomycetota bacterium]
MPIKGKKKPQTRGSQARRRPAAAPRPAYTSSRRVPWYRSPVGRGLVVIIGLVLVGLAVWGVGTARNNARADEARRESLDEYSGRMRAVLQSLAEPVSAMSAVPADSKAEVFDQLEETAKTWTRALRDASSEATTIFPPGDLEGTHQVFSEAIAIYVSAAQTYALAPDAEGALADSLLERAADLVSKGTAVWSAAIEVLDSARQEAGMDPSGLQDPTAVAPPAVPSPAPTAIEITPGDASGEAGGQGGKQGGDSDKKRKGSGND